jgi:hypothetical protein
LGYFGKAKVRILAKGYLEQKSQPMERYERYNRFLAVAGRTLAILFLLFLVLYFLLQIVGVSFQRGSSESPAGIVSGEEAARLAEDSIRRQMVSFNTLEILDSARQWYLLPVGQARLGIN